MYDLTTIRIKDLQPGDEFQRLGASYRVIEMVIDKIKIKRISGTSHYYQYLQSGSNEKVTLLKTLGDFVENNE